MRVRIRLFARLREIAGTAELSRELPEASTARAVWDGLAGEFPELAAYTTAISVAVNEEYARMTTPVHDGDEVAFLPPVSGGSKGGERLTRAARRQPTTREASRDEGRATSDRHAKRAPRTSDERRATGD